LNTRPSLSERIADRKIAVLLGLAVLGTGWMAALRLQREFEMLRLTLQNYALALQAYMVSDWLAFGIGQTLIATSGVLPASIVATMAGAVLGFGPGLVVSAASTMIGGWLAFSLSRTALRKPISRLVVRHQSVARLDQALTSEGWRMVMLLRVSPVMPFAMTSFGLGLTRISHRDFLLGTLASLPALTAFVALGALGRTGIGMTQDGATPSHWLAVAAGTAVVLYSLRRVQRIMQQLAREDAICGS
jgi:uncharacterized membrane protein YdjX (TVP38/TMEM64 family)